MMLLKNLSMNSMNPMKGFTSKLTRQISPSATTLKKSASGTTTSSGRGLAKPSCLKRAQQDGSCLTLETSRSVSESSATSMATTADVLAMMSAAASDPSEQPSACAGMDESSQSVAFTIMNPATGTPVRIAKPTLRGHPASPHRRSKALVQEDYQELLVKSRGWVYDPSQSQTGEGQPPTKPRHQDRMRNRALMECDFDQFIFAPRTTYAI